MIQRIFIAATIFFIGLIGDQAFAHQQKAAISEVLFNNRTGNIEVAHRFLLHDAEHAITDVLGVDGDLLGSSATQSAFADYVAARFTLADLDGNTMPLILLGWEIKGGYLWVYQETPSRENLSGLLVRHDALRDVWPEQVNRVNVKRGEKVQTLIFDSADNKIQVEFER